jgi:ribosomal protein S12 methylthiotransferase
MSLQQPIAFAHTASLVGRTLDVLVDGPDPEDPATILGRTYADAPDIDGVVRLPAAGLRAGDLVPSRIDESLGYDLAATPLELPRRAARPAAIRAHRNPLTILPG